MGRFADPYGDDNRLPEGMICIGYDADEGRRYYADRDGSSWVGAPYTEYGVLTPLRTKTTPQEGSSRHKRRTSSVNEPALPRAATRNPRKSATYDPIPHGSLSELIQDWLDDTAQGRPQSRDSEPSKTGIESQNRSPNPVSTIASHSLHSQSSSSDVVQQIHPSSQLETKETCPNPSSEPSSSVETSLTSNNSPAPLDGNRGHDGRDLDKEALTSVSTSGVAQKSSPSGPSDAETAPRGVQSSPISSSKPLLDKKLPKLPTVEVRLDEKMDAPVSPKTTLKRSIFGSLLVRKRGPR